jgi:predicted metal-dependent HD superfamily phosphohydrolase
MQESFQSKKCRSLFRSNDRQRREHHTTFRERVHELFLSFKASPTYEVIMASAESAVGHIAQAINLSRNSEFDATCYPSLKTALKAFWDEGVASLALDVDGTKVAISDEWYLKVYRQHNEAGRYYHTAVHLMEMLEYINILRQTGVILDLQLSGSMIWATFFHDVVYDPKSKRNEKDSAAMFQEFCQQITMPPSKSKVIETLILATELHITLPISDPTISLEEQEQQIAIQQMFLDIDMAVLGKERDAYLSYAALIRKEYSFVPSDVYCIKRGEILQQFLDDSKPLYLSIIFQGALEERARKNLEHEIHLLKQGMIPGETAISISSAIH